MGIIQGVVEWIPISSEGQIVFVSVEFYNLSPDIALSIAIWLHLGTLLAVLAKYRDDWWKIINYNNPDISGLRSLIVYTTIGTAIVAIPIRLLIFSIIDNQYISSILIGLIGLALILTGILMKKSENMLGTKVIDDLSIKEKIIIGMAQGLAIIPGVSRSGTTVSTFLMINVEKNESFKGSFIISAPAVLGAVLFDILLLVLDNSSITSLLSIWGIIVSITFAFFIGYLTMGIIIKIVNKNDFSTVTLGFGIVLIIFLLISF